MKETPISIRYYFILIGIIYLFNITNIALIRTNLMSGIWSIVSVVFGVIFLYVGIKFKDLVVSSAKKIIQVLYFYFGFTVWGLATTLFIAYQQEFKLSETSTGVMELVFSVIGVLISIYLIRNMKRISRLG